MNTNSASRPETRFSIKKKQINHFVRKKTIQVPKCRALVFFWGVYFVFRSKNFLWEKTKPLIRNGNKNAIEYKE